MIANYLNLWLKIPEFTGDETSMDIIREHYIDLLLNYEMRASELLFKSPTSRESMIALKAMPKQTERFSRFMDDGENVVYTSVVQKKNPNGMMQRRQLIWTDKHRLFYVDGTSIRGEIVIKNHNKKDIVVLINEGIFDVENNGVDASGHSKMKTLRFYDSNARVWVEKINASISNYWATFEWNILFIYTYYLNGN